MQISSTSSADDPVTHSVIQAALNATADEMFAVLRKTSMSPIIYEVLDVGTGITDAFGNLVCSGAGIPTFVGVLDKAVKRLIEIHGDTILDGDIFLTNDPYFGASRISPTWWLLFRSFRRRAYCMDSFDRPLERHRWHDTWVNGIECERDFSRRLAYPGCARVFVKQTHQASY